MSQTLTPMLGAMVICRSLARFIGYPPLHDATFTNTPLLHHFSASLDARAQCHTLWHLTPTDVSVIFTPLLDYAERSSSSSPRMLHAADIAHMQTQLTFDAAHALAKELDALTRGAQAPSWERWFALVLWARRRLDADDGDDGDIASANFYASCLSLCPPPPPPPPRSTPTPPPAATTTEEEADPFLSPHWTIASELRGDGAFALSPRMARLLAGSTPESYNTNWLNRGRYGRAPLEG